MMMRKTKMRRMMMSEQIVRLILIGQGWFRNNVLYLVSHYGWCHGSYL